MGALPVLPRATGIGGEEREIRFDELLSPYALNEIDLVPGRFQLSNGLVIIQQAHIDRRKVALIEHLGDFLALQRGCAHNRRAIKLSADGRRSGRTYDFRRTTHEVSEASL